MALPAEATAFLGQTLGGRFQIGEFLDEGYFSYVFDAIDLQTATRVAVKTLKPSASYARAIIEFEREGELLNLAGGATNVIGFVAAGEDVVEVAAKATGIDFQLPVRFIAMECAKGALDSVVASRHMVPWVDRLDVFRDVALAVHQLHSRFIVHRDLKSSNILLCLRGKSGMDAKITDLGRGKLVTAKSTLPARAYASGMGDLDFAAPEAFWMQVRADWQAWRAIDLYGLGSVLVELASGQGATALALPDSAAILATNERLSAHERSLEWASRKSEVAAKYDAAFAAIAGEFPPAIRAQALALIRTLCSHDPQLRDPRRKINSIAELWSANWILRRIDILRLLMRRNSRS